MNKIFNCSFFILASFLYFQAHAQKTVTKADKDKLAFDSVKVMCPDIPREKRPRLTVARFSVTAPNAPQDQFGDNLATMLSNALQGVNCYRILERLKDSSDMLDEQKFQSSGNVGKGAVKKNKMLGANVIVTGEVITYEESSKNLGVALVHTTKSTAKIEINIKLVDPETRDVIDQHTFSAEKKINGGMNVGTYIPYIGGINAMSSAMKNPAVQGAVQDAINAAVYYISNERDKIPMPESNLAEGATESNIIVQNIQYEKVSQLASAIEKIPGVSSVNSDQFDGSTATLVVDHKLKMKDLIAKIMQSNTGVRLGVQTVTTDGATLAVK